MDSKESISLEELVEIMKDIQVPEDTLWISTPEQLEYFKKTLSPGIKAEDTNSTIFGVPVVVSKFLPGGNLA